MTRGVLRPLISTAILIALIGLAGCSHYMISEREPWRRDAESACLNAGGAKESPTRVRIASIDGPGACGISYPLKISSLGDGPPLGYSDEALTPPGAIPGASSSNSSMPQHWPIAQSNMGQPAAVQSNALPPLQSSSSPYGAPPSQTYAPPASQPPYNQSRYSPAPYPQSQYGAQSGAPMSLRAPGIPEPTEEDVEAPAGAPSYQQGYSPRPQPSAAEPIPPLGPQREPMLTAGGAVEVKPAATLACPIVSALDQWIDVSVQPAAMRWFRQPVVEIKQISAYSCRGMNGNPNAHISEHAFGNALDVAEFILADGHKVSVQYGWHGAPEEQAFLHDVQSAACDQFTTVLAPGANVYHYNHIHVDLMRHYNGRHICEPSAISGQVAFERARAQYAAKHGDPSITGSLGKKIRNILGYSEETDKHPNAVPGDD